MDVIFDSVFSGSLTLKNTLIMLACALGLGLLTALCYMFTHRRDGYSSGIVIPVILVPAISASIILLVGTNTAAALSLAGAAAVIRFRTTLGSPKDLTYLFFSLAVGLGCGTGFVGYTATFAVIVLIVTSVIELCGVGRVNKGFVKVRVTVPEDLNYPDAFDDIMEKYTLSNSLSSVKTTEFGSLCELVYLIKLKKGVTVKEFIDSVRERNGNLSVNVMLHPSEDKSYIA